MASFGLFRMSYKSEDSCLHNIAGGGVGEEASVNLLEDGWDRYTEGQHRLMNRWKNAAC